MKAVFSRIWYTGLLVVVLLGFAITCLSSSNLLGHLPHCAPHLYSCVLVAILPWLLFTMCVLVPVAVVSADSAVLRERIADIPAKQAVAALVACAALILMMLPPVSFSWMRTSGLSRFLLPLLGSVTMAGALIALIALSARSKSATAAAASVGAETDLRLITGGTPTRAVAGLIAIAYAYAVSTNTYGTGPALLSILIVMTGVFCISAFLLAHAPRIVGDLFRRSGYPVLRGTVLATVAALLILIPRLFLIVGDSMTFPVYSDPTGFLLLVEGQAVFAVACLASAVHRRGDRTVEPQRPMLILGLCFPLWFVAGWSTFYWLDWGSIHTVEPWQRFSSVTGVITLVVFFASAIRGLMRLLAGRNQTRTEKANP